MLFYQNGYSENSDNARHYLKPPTIISVRYNFFGDTVDWREVSEWLSNLDSKVWIRKANILEFESLVDATMFKLRWY